MSINASLINHPIACPFKRIIKNLSAVFDTRHVSTDHRVSFVVWFVQK